MKKLIGAVVSMVGAAVLVPVAAFAHVVVTPANVNVGDSVSFNLSVPNERDADMVSVKLAIPKGVSDVSPDVTGGWTITTEKSGDDVTSITWNGTIPAGQRADLAFKAQAPASAGELDWKAYQTYADGTNVSWDQKPVANAPDDDAALSGPYSVTKVTDDLSSGNTTAAPTTDARYQTLTLVLSIVAIVFSIFAVLMRRRN